MKTLFGDKIISSVSFSNDEIIQDIMYLHKIDRFDLDCTYSTGVFWKNLKKPINKTDLYPKNKNIIQADSSNLPFKSISMKSIMFDPPFIIAGKNYSNNKKGSSIIAKRFEGYENYEQLKHHYYGTLKECNRLLIDNGILVFKCQDVVSSGKNHFTHNMIMQMAISLGFFPKDLFILVSKNRINSFNGSKWKNQYHARKYHSYFWVFQKGNNKVNYSFNEEEKY